MMLPLFIFSLVIVLSNASVSDFCVADISMPETPSGYPCKSPTKVTVNDFVYSGLGIAGNTTNILKAVLTTAFDAQFPAMNGMGISIVRLDMAAGGFVPLHTHPRGHEILIVIEGTIIAGFISSTNVAYYKTLNKGDIMVLPKGLIHFQINSGNSSALAFAGFSGSNPGIQTLDYAMFSNSLPSDLIEKVTLLDDPQVKKLKGLFGGTN